MSEPFECTNCERQIELDSHGRCSHCGSDAVFPTALYGLKKKKKRVTRKQKDVKELEKIIKL